MSGIIFGLLTTIFIARNFTADLQGYFYTFNSVLALKIFFELGLSVVIISFVSHEWARVHLKNDGNLIGPTDSIKKISDIGAFANRWFHNAGLIAFLVLLVFGTLFFNSKVESKNIDWFWQWVALSVMTAICIALTPVWAILEGCNQTIEVYKVRFVQSSIAGLLICTGIYINLELWVVTIAPLVELLACLYLARVKYKKLLSVILFRNIKTYNNQIWKHEIFQMQWRISLSWIGGYLTFSIFTPILFYYHGPIVAGQMGMTWMFLGALTSFASSWVVPKLPVFGGFISVKDWRSLDMQFWTTVKQIGMVSGLIGAGMFIALYALPWIDVNYANRLLDVRTAGIFILATIILCISLPFSTYLRAHKQEPLLIISLFGGVLNAVLVWLLSISYSALGAAIAYLVVTVLQVPFIYGVWHRKRIEWHQ